MNSIEAEGTVVIARVVGLVFGILIINHFIACMWYSIGIAEEVESWLDRGGLYDASNPHAYASAFHWSLTQFTPATNNLAPVSLSERLFACAVVLVALITFSTFLGKMTSAMSQLVNLNTKRYQREAVVRRFMGEYKIPSHTAQMVWQLFRHQACLDERRPKTGLEEICEIVDVPQQLRSVLCTHMFLKVVRELPILRLTIKPRSKTARDFCSRLVENAAPRGKSVFSEGAEARGAFCVNSGQVAYFHFHKEDGQTTTEQSAPAWFSEAALWGHWKHRGTLTTLGTARWLTLEGQAFQEFFKHSTTGGTYLLLSHYSAMFELAAQEGLCDGTLTDLSHPAAQDNMAKAAAGSAGWTPQPHYLWRKSAMRARTF